jgi:hypothetical protein
MNTSMPTEIDFLQKSLESLKTSNFKNINLTNVWEFVKQCMVLTEKYVDGLPKNGDSSSIDKKLLCMQLVQSALDTLNVSDPQTVKDTISPSLGSFIEVIIEVSKFGIAINEKTNCLKKLFTLLKFKKN